MPKLGRLEQGEIRDVWENEEKNFTPWLAEPGNIGLLGEAIGVELELVAQEQSVGPFRADILCKDTVNGRYVLVENQLERTDHVHLGQIITYAANLNAVIIVWIARKLCDEHRAALDWLNEITDDSANFFGLEIEVWKIGESEWAPKFNVACQPNEWLKSSPPGPSTLGPAQQLQLEFWKAFKGFLEDKQSPVHPTKPLPQHWMNLGIGRSGFNLGAIAGTWDAETKKEVGVIRVDLTIDNVLADQAFEALRNQQGEIEKEFGEPLTWYKTATARTRRIYSRKLVDIADRADWPVQFAWLEDHLVAFRTVLGPRIKQLELAAPANTDASFAPVEEGTIDGHAEATDVST